MRRLTCIVAAIPAFLTYIVCGLTLEAQQKDKGALPPVPKSPAAQPAPAPKAPQIKVDKAEAKFGGRVNVDVEANKLPRFDKPKDPPKEPPPKEKPKDKDGRDRHGHWHWHRHHGWILLPQPLPTLVIPDTYVLPPRVTYYSAPAVLPVRVICPHCGQPIYVHVD